MTLSHSLIAATLASLWAPVESFRTSGPKPLPSRRKGTIAQAKRAAKKRRNQLKAKGKA